MNAQNIKKFSLKNLDFYKSLKIYVIIILNLPANLFWFVLFCTKRRCLQTEPQLNIEIEDGRKAPLLKSSRYKWDRPLEKEEVS